MLMAAAALLRDDAAPERGGGRGRARRRALPLHRLPQDRRRGAATPGARREPAPAPAAGAAVGARLPRLDGRAKVEGREAFGADAWRPGGLVLKAVRSPHARAAFAFGDLAAWAAARPEVAAVFTAARHPRPQPLRRHPALRRPAGAGRRRGAVPRRGGGAGRLRGPARRRLRPRRLPRRLDPAAGARRPAGGGGRRRGAACMPAGRGNQLIEGRVRRGDAAAGAGGLGARGGVRDRAPASSSTPTSSRRRAPPGWRATTLVIRACTQAPYMDRDDTAAVLGLPPERVRIVPSAVGGGFGAKLDLSVQPLLGLAALRTGRPVRMTFTRPRVDGRDHQAAPGAHPRPRSAATPEGRLTGARLRGRLRHRRLCELGADGGEPGAGARDRPLPGAARCMARARAVHTHGPVSGAFRGFGVPQAAIAQETLIDRLAEAAGIDRLEFRLRNALARRRRHRHRPGAGGRRHRRLPRGAARRAGRAALAEAAATPAAASSGAGSGWRRAGTAAATPRCRTPRPSGSGCAPTARWCCTRARSTSARARRR